MKNNSKMIFLCQVGLYNLSSVSQSALVLSNGPVRGLQ